LSGWDRRAIKAFFRRATGRRRVLLVDHVPAAILGAGSPRAAEFQRAIVEAGARLTLLPARDPIDATVARPVLPGRELALGYGVAGIGRFLAERRDRFDVIIVSRPNNMAAFRLVADQRPDLIGRAAVVYDAEALFAEREALRLRVLGRPLSAAESELRTCDEIRLARGCRIVLAVSEAIAELFRAAGQPDVRVLGHAVAPQAAGESFSERDDILFVGPTYGDDTPNTDSVVWFVDNVLPRVRQGLGRDIPLVFVGISRAGAIARRGDGRLKMHGAVPDLTSIYARARLFVAPTRFASGLPIKVLDAAAHGVPVVLTPLLAGQLGWRHEQEVLVAETAEEFAAACLRLYSDRALWERLQAAALRRVAADCDPRRFDRTVSQMLYDAAETAWAGV
jgi:glycosyltransferase involved in cell wall biosynthesis